jgi:tRNA-binding protein
VTEISWEQFEAVDMRVGRVIAVEEFPEARVAAWKLEIHFGPELGVRRSSAQIKNYDVILLRPDTDVALGSRIA